jgi:outer membrane murein-binding lipoprotein Lpp
MKKTILILTLMTGCVSPKKYNALMSEYQKAGVVVRDLSQEVKILRIDTKNQSEYIKQGEKAIQELNCKIDSLTPKKEVSHDE